MTVTGGRQFWVKVEILSISVENVQLCVGALQHLGLSFPLRLLFNQ